LHSPTLSTTDLRWKIDALPDPTHPTGSLISGRAEVRHKIDQTIDRATAGRKVISKSAADRIIEGRIIEELIIAEQIIEAALAKGPVRTIRDGATGAPMDAPMGDSQEKTGLARAVRTVVRIRGEARPAAPSSLSLKRIS
jgi:hypothetical protein